MAVIFLHRSVTGPAQIKIRAAHLAGPDVAFRFSCRLPCRVFCPSEFFITGYIHHLQSELSLLVCRRSCACHFIRPCGKDRIQKGVLREVIDERNNHIAEKQKALAGAGMGHVGKLVGRDVELLCEDLPVSVGLIEHIHKVRVLKNIRYFGTCQQIFDVLR